MDIDVKEIVEREIRNQITGIINDSLTSDSYSRNDARKVITDKIADRFINENYEEIVQKISKEDIANLVTQRAILLSAALTINAEVR